MFCSVLICVVACKYSESADHMTAKHPKYLKVANSPASSDIALTHPRKRGKAFKNPTTPISSVNADTTVCKGRGRASETKYNGSTITRRAEK